MIKQKSKVEYTKSIFKVIPLILILAAGIFARILFYRSINDPIEISDSVTYIGGAKNMLKYLCLDEYRPPVYLIQLLLLGIIFTWENLKYVTVLIQCIIGLLTVFTLFKLVEEAFRNKLAAYIAAFFTAVSMTIYCWDFMILTENLSIFLITETTYYLIIYLKYNNIKHLKILTALLILCLFTKPFFMVLPILTAFILLFNYMLRYGFKIRLNSHLKTALAGFAGIYICLFIYSGINQLQHSFFGVTTVGKVNTFGKILQYGMEDYGSNSNLVDDVKEAFSSSEPKFIVEGKFLEPWHFIGTYGWNANHYIEIGDFAREIIIENPVEYAIKSLALTGKLLVNSPFKDYIAESEVIKAGHPEKLMLLLKSLTKLFDSLYFLILVFSLESVLIIIFKRKKLLQKNYGLQFCILLFILYHYLVSAFFSYGDYCRLLAPCFPLIYAVIALYIARAAQYLFGSGFIIYDKIFRNRRPPK